MKNKYKSLATNTLIFAIGSFGSKLLLFFLVPLYTNVLTTSEYGISDLVVNIGKLVLPVISLTIYDALFPFCLSGNDSKEDVFANVTLVFTIGALVTIATTPLWDYYSPISEWKWHLTAYIITSFLLENNLLYLKVKELNKLYSILCIAQSLFLVAFNIIFLLVLKKGVSGYLVSLILSNFITALLALMLGSIVSDLKKATINITLLKKMICYTAPLIISSILWLVMHSSDKIMIEWLIGSASLGLYSAASKIPSLIGTVSSIFNQAWSLSAINEYASTNDKKFYSNVMNFYLILIFLGGMGIIAISQPFMHYYVGIDFEESWLYVPILILGSIYSSIAIFINTFYVAMKKSIGVMISTLLAGIVNIVVNFLLIPAIGIQGATIGTLTAYLLLTAMRWVDLRRYLVINLDIIKIIILILLSSTQCILVLVVKKSFFISMPFLILAAIFCRKEIKECFFKVIKIVPIKRN